MGTPPFLPSDSSPAPSIWQRVGAYIPGIGRALAGLAAVAGNPRAAQMYQQQDELNLQQQEMANRRALLASQLQNADLSRQLQQKEIDNYQTPEQKLQMQRQYAEPQDFVGTVEGQPGVMGRYQRTYNPKTNSYDVTPTMVTENQVVSSPSAPKVPFSPDQIITRQTQRQLLAAPKVTTPDEATYKFLTDSGMAPDVALERIKNMAVPKQSGNVAEQLKSGIVDALNKGDQPTANNLQSQLKAIDPLGQQRINVSIAGQQAAQNRYDTTASRQDIRDHDKAYVQPAESVEKSYQLMQHAYDEYQSARAQGQELPTGAQSMVALSTHLATTFGNVKGARVTKDMIQEHLGARGVGDMAQVAIQRLTNGDALSPGQWNAFHDLLAQSRKLSWQTAVKQAQRKDVPVDFLPSDLEGLSGAGANGAPPAGAGGVQIIRDPNGRIIGVK